MEQHKFNGTTAPDLFYKSVLPDLLNRDADFRIG